MAIFKPSVTSDDWQLKEALYLSDRSRAIRSNLSIGVIGGFLVLGGISATAFFAIRALMKGSFPALGASGACLIIFPSAGAYVLRIALMNWQKFKRDTDFMTYDENGVRKVNTFLQIYENSDNWKKLKKLPAYSPYYLNRYGIIEEQSINYLYEVLSFRNIMTKEQKQDMAKKNDLMVLKDEGINFVIAKIPSSS